MERRRHGYFQKSLFLGKLKFEIAIDRSGTLLQGMRNGLFDICICVVPANNVLDEDVKLIKNFYEELVPVSSKIWKNNFSEIPFILYNKESSTRDYIDKTFFDQRIKATTIVESTNTMFMKELALGGCGIALLPRNVIEKEIENKKLFVKNFPFKFKRKIGIFLSRDGRIKEKDRIIKDIIANLKT